MRCWFQKDCDIKTIGLMHFTQLILNTEPLRKPFEIGGADPRREKKLTGGTVKMYIHVHFYLRV